MAYRYVTNNTQVKALRKEPCTSALDADLTNAVNAAEDKVDAWLNAHAVATPLTGAKITDDLKEAVAVMAQACLYYSYQLAVEGRKREDEAGEILERFLLTTDVSKGTDGSTAGAFNYQTEFIENWAEPNDVAEDMDD